MLVSIVGCPCSGKTTVAAKVFALLKDHCFTAEYISEQARYYISTQRVKKSLTYKDEIILSDEDQINIMKQQLAVEDLLLKTTNPHTIIICDSSALNALLYMNQDTKQLPQVKELILQSLTHYDMIFYAKPLEIFSTADAGRIHSQQQSILVDKILPDVMSDVGVKVERSLEGDSEVRCIQMYSSIMNKIMDS